MDEPKKQVMIPVEQALPKVNELVIAVGKSFRCLAYIDFNGVWRDHARNRLLTDVIGWYR